LLLRSRSARELLVALRDPKHHLSRLGAVHMLCLNANFLSAVAPVLRIVNQAFFHRKTAWLVAIPQSPLCDTAPQYQSRVVKAEASGNVQRIPGLGIHYASRFCARHTMGAAPSSR
jgi:hypothetical protein